MTPALAACVPLTAGLVYALSALYIKQATVEGGGLWRVNFLINWGQAVFMAPLLLLGHGPLDPTFGASPAYLAESMRTGRMLVNRAGRGYIDARDLAALLERTLARGLGPRRLMCGGRYVADEEIRSLLSGLTGQPIQAMRIPGPILRAMGRIGDAAQLLTGRSPALSYEAACVITRSVPCDDTEALALLGRPWLPIERSLQDLLVWMRQAGHLSASEAGPAIDALARNNSPNGY